MNLLYIRSPECVYLGKIDWSVGKMAIFNMNTNKCVGFIQFYADMWDIIDLGHVFSLDVNKQCVSSYPSSYVFPIYMDENKMPPLSDDDMVESKDGGYLLENGMYFRTDDTHMYFGNSSAPFPQPLDVLDIRFIPAWNTVKREIVVYDLHTCMVFVYDENLVQKRSMQLNVFDAGYTIFDLNSKKGIIYINALVGKGNVTFLYCYDDGRLMAQSKGKELDFKSPVMICARNCAFDIHKECLYGVVFGVNMIRTDEQNLKSVIESLLSSN